MGAASAYFFDFRLLGLVEKAKSISSSLIPYRSRKRGRFNSIFFGSFSRFNLPKNDRRLDSISHASRCTALIRTHSDGCSPRCLRRSTLIGGNAVLSSFVSKSRSVSKLLLFFYRC